LPTFRDCPKASNSCDCESDNAKKTPLCESLKSSRQVRGKAYPTLREFTVVKALGDQGIISSICPIDTKDSSPSNANFGYRPAVKTIVDRLKNALSVQCLPQPLNLDAENKVPCLVLETITGETDQGICDNKAKYPEGGQPPAEVLQRKKASLPDGGKNTVVCKLGQLAREPGKTCADDRTSFGWCYVKNVGDAKPAGACPQAVLFTDKASRESRSTYSLECIRGSEVGSAPSTTTDGGAATP
jgi:hypothetical protein